MLDQRSVAGATPCAGCAEALVDRLTFRNLKSYPVAYDASAGTLTSKPRSG